MRTSVFAMAMLLSLAACSEPRAIIGALPNGSAASVADPIVLMPQAPSASDEELVGGVCRYILTRRPPTMRLFDYTASAGGRTCYQDGKTILLLPTSASECSLPDDFDVEGVENISLPEAQAHYVACSALSGPHQGTPGKSLVYRPSDKSTEQDEGFFIQFGFDMSALVSNDGLPVSAYFMEEYEVCVETDVPAEVDRRVRESDIVNFDFVDVELRDRRCEAA